MNLAGKRFGIKLAAVTLTCIKILALQTRKNFHVHFQTDPFDEDCFCVLWTAMRVKVVLSADFRIEEHRRKLLLEVPAECKKVADLTSYVSRLLSLVPTSPLIASIEGFTLLPNQLLSIIRETDIIR